MRCTHSFLVPSCDLPLATIEQNGHNPQSQKPLQNVEIRSSFAVCFGVYPNPWRNARSLLSVNTVQLGSVRLNQY